MPEAKAKEAIEEALEIGREVAQSRAMEWIRPQVVAVDQEVISENEKRKRERETKEIERGV